MGAGIGSVFGAAAGIFMEAGDGVAEGKKRCKQFDRDFKEHKLKMEEWRKKHFGGRGGMGD